MGYFQIITDRTKDVPMLGDDTRGRHMVRDILSCYICSQPGEGRGATLPFLRDSGDVTRDSDNPRCVATPLTPAPGHRLLVLWFI